MSKIEQAINCTVCWLRCFSRKRVFVCSSCRRTSAKSRTTNKTDKRTILNVATFSRPAEGQACGSKSLKRRTVYRGPVNERVKLPLVVGRETEMPRDGATDYGTGLELVQRREDDDALSVRRHSVILRYRETSLRRMSREKRHGSAGFAKSQRELRARQRCAPSVDSPFQDDREGVAGEIAFLSPPSVSSVPIYRARSIFFGRKTIPERG